MKNEFKLIFDLIRIKKNILPVCNTLMYIPSKGTMKIGGVLLTLETPFQERGDGMDCGGLCAMTKNI